MVRRQVVARRSTPFDASMGIYDRDYEREQSSYGGGYDSYGRPPGVHVNAPQTVLTKLMIITCGVYVAQLIVTNGWVTRTFLLPDEWYLAPWQAYRLLTYGFLHSTRDLWHIVLNMWAFWLFGRDIEAKYSSREFLAFYLYAIVAAGLCWSLAELSSAGNAAVLGASGGVAAVLVLYALNFPHRTVLFMFVLPMPMWVLALIVVGMDMLGAIRRESAGNVAVVAHLGGALFGLLYYQFSWQLSKLIPTRVALPTLRRRPKLRVHQPTAEDREDTELDDVLRKIRQQGQDSLTRQERRILERASKEFQQRRR